MTIKIPAPIHQPEPPLDLLGNQHQNFEDTQHQFNARESDWAFTSSMPFGELYDRSRGYLVDDTVIIQPEVLIPRVVDYLTYDSKKETGFVGLKNQGATCYMNSLLQNINDRYEFPMQLDLDQENGKYLSPEADRSFRNLYILHSVLVHSGGVHGGHYYASIRPALSDQWYKFDDERVTKENIERALEEQYGGEEETKAGFNNSFKFTKHSSAYILVYIRESFKDDKICNIDLARLQFTFNSFLHLSRLSTKGTTIVMFAQQDNFFIVVDSRETFTTKTDTFILNEYLKKYHMFGDSTFATFVGHIHIS